MQVSSKYNLNFSTKILKQNYISNKPEKDSFTTNKISFKANSVFPFEHLGLNLSKLSFDEIPELATHIAYVVKAENHSSVNFENTKECLEKLIQDPNSITHIIKDSSNKIIGSGTLTINYFGGKITNLFIHPNWQKKGLGTWLMKDFLQTCEQKRISLLRLTTENPIAENLYQKLGFEKIYTYDDTKTIMMKGDIPLIYKLYKHVPVKVPTELFV